MYGSFQCLRCGYHWRGRWQHDNEPVHQPKRCARCRSKYWDRSRRRSGGFADPSVVNPSVERKKARLAAEAERRASWEHQEAAAQVKLRRIQQAKRRRARSGRRKVRAKRARR